MLKLRVLGRLELFSDGTPVLAGRRKPLALLLYLVRRGARPSTRDELADLLWADSAETLARKSLRQALFELRPFLGESLLAEESAVRLADGAVEIDASAFEADVAAGRWSDAIERYHGDLLIGMEDVGGERWRSWLEAERESLRRLLGIAFERLTDAHDKRGEWAATLAAGERWVALLPTDERACIRVVTSLRFLGRSAEAAARHASFLQRLRRDFGIEPPAALLAAGHCAPRDAAQIATAPPGARALLSPDVVGRSESFSVLSRAWDSVRSGAGGRVVVVFADEGLGKTRLVAEFVRRLRSQRLPTFVVEGRGYVTERTRDYAMLRPMLVQLADAEGIAGTPPVVLAGLARIAPELRDHFRHLPESTSAEVVGEQLRRAIAEAAAEQPLLLAVDDAPDGDEKSAAALAVLVRRPPPGLMLLLTGRPSSWASSPFRGDVERASTQLDRIELAPLSAADSLSMLASMVPLAPDSGASLANRLHAESGGNPGQLLQLMAHLADTGRVAPGPSGLWQVTSGEASGTLPLPATLRDAFIARLDNLSSTARHLAELASVAGPGASADLLEAASNLPGDQFRSALGELLTGRILRDRGSGQGLEFPSEANRRVAYDGIEPSRRRQLHGALYREASARAGGGGQLSESAAYHLKLSGAKPPSRRRLRTTFLGVVALVLLVVAGVIWRGRAAHVTPGSTVLLADVQNLTGDSLFGRALLAAATVQLQQSSRVVVFPRSRVSQTLVRMQRQKEDTALSEALAREVAEREGVRIVVVLGVARFDSSYELSARLVDPRSGRDLRTEHQAAKSRTEVIPALGRLLAATRRDLGESRAAVGADGTDLPRVTTTSLEALRAYALGNLAWTARDYLLARDEYLRAVSLDSGFSLAWSSLADYAYVQNLNRRDGGKYLDRAMANIGRLTEREQLVLRAKEQAYRGSQEEAIRLRRLLAERFPERENWFNYGTTLMRNRRCGEAIPALRRAIQLDSLFTNAWINVATCEQFEGKVADAIADYTRANATDSLALVRGNINHEFGVALMRLGMLDSAEQVYRRQASRMPQDDARKGYRSLAYVEMLRGQYARALAHLDTAFVISSQLRVWTSAFRDALLRAQAARSAGDIPRVQRATGEAWNVFRVHPIDIEVVFFAGLELAVDGPIARARSMLDSIRAQARPGSATDASKIQMVTARIALATGHPAQARAALLLATDTVFQTTHRAVLSETFQALGMPDSALVVAEQLGQFQRLGDEQQDAWLRAPLRVGRLAAQLGDTARARSAFELVVKRWATGDPTLPGLVEARRALNGLSSAVAETRGRSVPVVRPPRNP